MAGRQPGAADSFIVSSTQRWDIATMRCSSDHGGASSTQSVAEAIPPKLGEVHINTRSSPRLLVLSSRCSGSAPHFLVRVLPRFRMLAFTKQRVVLYSCTLAFAMVGMTFAILDAIADGFSVKLSKSIFGLYPSGTHRHLPLSS